MDYTLAVYKSPDFESMAFDLIVNRLISLGYPEDLKELKYNPIFPVRGLWFDMIYGNLLKVDGFGNILIGCHGLSFLTPYVLNFNSNKCIVNVFLALTLKTVIQTSLFSFMTAKFMFSIHFLIYQKPILLLASLITSINHPNTQSKKVHFSFFATFTTLENFPKCQRFIVFFVCRTNDKTGVKSGEVIMSYKSIFQDVRAAVDYVHFDGGMKKCVLENLSKYVENDSRIKTLLTQLRENDRKTFLLTNSDYTYTNVSHNVGILKDKYKNSGNYAISNWRRLDRLLRYFNC